MSNPHYIHGLRAENILRLELVDLDFTGPGLEVISGKNAQGKSSLLNAIAMALGGKGEIPDRPVREGADHGDVTLDLGDKVVRLRVKPDRSSTLTVESKEGAPFTSPQRILSELIGTLAFDPLAFAEMDGKKQAEALRHLVGLDTSDLDAEREGAFVSRTDVNRRLKLAEASEKEKRGMYTATEVRAALPLDVEVSISELAARHVEASGRLAALNALKAKRASAAVDLARFEDEARKLAERIAKGHAYLAAVDAQIAGAEVPDLEAITVEMQGAEKRNKMVSWHRQWKSAQAEVTKLESESAGLTARIAELDAQKQEALAMAEFPLEGLGVEGDSVTFNGLPLAQASTAERLRVCLSIAAKLNPNLRVLLVREGNDLDAERLKMVGDWARTAGYQVLIERVAGDRPAGIVIEAGRVLADHRDAKPENGAQLTLAGAAPSKPKAVKRRAATSGEAA